MKTEKAILYFIATLIGLLVSGVAFYLYQATKTVPVPKDSNLSINTSPSPTPSSSFFLSLDSPRDEEVVDKRIITISGKTQSDAVIVILSGASQQILTPSLSGSFSTTMTLENNQNLIEITAIAPNGEEKKVIRTVTYSNEDF